MGSISEVARLVMLWHLSLVDYFKSFSALTRRVSLDREFQHRYISMQEYEYIHKCIAVAHVQWLECHSA